MEKPLRLKKCAQEGKHADKPGSYRLVARVDRQLVDPGDQLRIGLVVTGYGRIDGCKVVAYPSPGVFDNSASWVQFGPRFSDDLVTWGGQRIPYCEGGFAIDIGSGGVNPGGWTDATLFFDTDSSGPTPQIFTETITLREQGEQPPIAMRLAIHKRSRPGVYSVPVTMTYFNGQSWATQSIEVQFTVRGFYQRHEIAIWFVGALIGVLSLVSSWVGCG